MNATKGEPTMHTGHRKSTITGRQAFFTRLGVAMVAAGLIAGLLPGGQALAAFPGTNGKILFTRFAASGAQLFVTDASGATPTPVTPNLGLQARYSPDRTKIAYVSPDSQIFVASVDNSGVVIGTPTQLTHSPSNSESPSWYPNGTKIAYKRDTEISVMDAALGDSTAQFLTSDTAHPEPQDTQPAVSPDGKTIAWARTGPDGLLQIYLMDADPALAVSGNGGHRRPLLTAESGGLDLAPSWSPDGKKLAFTSNKIGNRDVFRADLSGTSAADFMVTALTNLTNTTTADEEDPQFSPDGTKIAFDRLTSTDNVYVMGSDGSNPTLVAANGGPSDWAAAPSTTTHHAPADFDGNATTDVSVFRPSNGTWYVNGGATTTWGTSGDIPVPGNYTGTAITNVAVYRPGSAGTWYINGGPIVAWGTTGDIPVPGDYNGDGTTDIAVFRPSTGTWFVNGGAIVNWGTSGDIPVPGNYSGTATTDIAVYRPGNNTWFVRNGATTTWGTTDDIPLPLPAAIRMATAP